MHLLGFDIKFPTWTRDKNGNTFSDITSYNEWSKFGNNLGIAQNHPILTPALLFVSKLFSQANFTVERISTGKAFDNSKVLALLNNPNAHQTRADFLETLMFMQIANGVGVIYTKRNMLSGTVNSLYTLDYSLIVFPDSLKKGNFINASQTEKYLNTEILYDPHHENLKIKLKDLMFLYDLPNAMQRNPYKVVSRIDGLKQTLINTQDSLIAKNIILKSNGKELISTIKDGFPLNPEEKAEMEKAYSEEYGVTFNRKRGMVVQASVTHKSLHIALRDLGLDESIKVDGNIVYKALHIPKDIISLEAKKTTYNNFKESMVSYLQNEQQSSLDSLTAVFNKVLTEDGLELKGDYEHLPIMQFILIERYKGVWERGNALLTLRKSGLPDKVALGLVGLDENIVLGDIVETQAGGSGDGDGDSTKITPEQEEKIRELIQNEL